MKKTILRQLISAFLLVCMLISSLSLISCDSSDGSQSSDTETSDNGNVAEEVTPDTPKTNYNETFYLSIMPDSNDKSKFWVEKSEGDAMSEAVFTRQEKVKAWSGVTIISTKMLDSHQEYATSFKTTVKNKDGSVDTLISHVHSGVSSLVYEGFLLDLNQMNGINLDADYWNMDFMSSLSLADHYYLGFSDFNILRTYVIAFNKTLLSEMKISGYSESELYGYVKDFKWTIDRFIEVAKAGFREKGDNDIYGLIGKQWEPWVGFLQSCNINLIEINDSGTYELSLMNEKNKIKTVDLVNKMEEFSSSGYVKLNYPDTLEWLKSPVPEERVTNNRALMQLTSTTYGLEDFINFDISFGVLPYPMYDEMQGKGIGYRSLQWGGYICVPTYLRNANMTADTLELLAFYSKDVRVAFYEKLLGKQIADAPNDKIMLDIAWEGICTDFGQTYCDIIGGTGFLYIFPRVTYSESGYELVSYYKSLENSANQSIRKLLKIVEKLNKQ